MYDVKIIAEKGFTCIHILKHLGLFIIINYIIILKWLH